MSDDVIDDRVTGHGGTLPPDEQAQQARKAAETAGKAGKTNHPVGPPLPATRQALQEQRLVQHHMTLNDYVDDLHLEMYEDPTYQRLFKALWDEQSVEGWVVLDEATAANRIRELARDKNLEAVTKENLATVIKSLRVVTRRFNISRRQRRNMVHGEIVPPNGDENNSG